ncbi:MAG: SDR family NAD(P)-dependent oxidoreductase, partial [Cytophagales bacterium]|nr:SDR family NAD(P)-dependent oxidoreductase [Cytophagales bacterium]
MPKVAIVTAASKGIGAACARELHALGYDMALMARGKEVLSLGKSLNALALEGSVTEKADLKRLVEMTMHRYGQIDGVINNTGHPPKGDLLSLTREDWHYGLDLVLMNVVHMAQLVTPIMLAQGNGAFVNISTFAAFEPSLQFPISSSLRAA